MKPSVADQILDGRSAICWRRSERRRFARAPQEHDELVVLHGLGGQMSYLIGGRIVRLTAGSLLWAFAGQPHVLLDETPDFDMWVFLVSARALEGAQGDLPPLHIRDVAGETAPRRLPPRQSDELATLAAGVAAQQDGPETLHGVRWWLARAWRLWRDAPAGNMLPVHPAVDGAARELERDPTLTLEELGSRVGLSPGRLGALFRRQTGKSIVRHRAELKLDRIDRALQSRPQTSLLTAAMDAGFGSYPQFYRTFRAVRGVSPFHYYRRMEFRS